jgi:hypothetical protein
LFVIFPHFLANQTEHKDKYDSRVSEELGVSNGEGADGELEELEALGGALGLGIGGVGRVEGEEAVPRRRHGAGPLQRHGDEVGVGDVGLDLRERFLEVRLGHLLHAPLLAGFCAKPASLRQPRKQSSHGWSLLSWQCCLCPKEISYFNIFFFLENTIFCKMHHNLRG